MTIGGNVWTTIPPQPKVKKNGQLSEAQVKQFFEDGYVILTDFFDTKKDLEPCKESIAKSVDALARKLHKAGKIKDLCESADLWHRLTLIDKQFPGAGILMHKGEVELLSEPIQKLWTHEKLLNIMEQLIGPDIGGNPVWNLRTKLPNTEAADVPWHQDAAYMDDSSMEVNCVTAWIPLLDACKENGTLQVVKGGHRTGKLAHHECCYGQTHYVTLTTEEMEKTLCVNAQRDTVTCNIPYGGLLLFNNVLPHRSLENVSDVIRWSFDLRWQDPHKPWGYHGLKEGILFRSAQEPNLKPDWETFRAGKRSAIAATVFTNEKKFGNVIDTGDDFDVTIVGPWMARWPMNHDNRNLKALRELVAAKGGQAPNFQDLEYLP